MKSLIRAKITDYVNMSCLTFRKKSFIIIFIVFIEQKFKVWRKRTWGNVQKAFSE